MIKKLSDLINQGYPVEEAFMLLANESNSLTAGDTRFLIFDVDNNTLERVTVGIADSGGAGFKLLRIPN